MLSKDVRSSIEKMKLNIAIKHCVLLCNMPTLSNAGTYNGKKRHWLAVCLYPGKLGSNTANQQRYQIKSNQTIL